MHRNELNDLAAFSVVAEERSFTRAASKLGMSQSALSHAVKSLETRIGLPLLARTTRSVSTTEAGERLLRILLPALKDIASELGAMKGSREQPSGSVRIVSAKHPAMHLLWPRLTSLLEVHPDINVEIVIDEGWTDIVAGRFDAGVRLAEGLAPGMIAVKIGPEIRSVVVGAPAYFLKHKVPQSPDDLASHNCINYRLSTAGGLFPWEFEKDGQPFSVKVSGQIVFNDTDLMVHAALQGRGLAYAFEDQVATHLANGELITVLDDWLPPYPGFCLYYPSRHQTSALAAVIEALRWRDN